MSEHSHIEVLHLTLMKSGQGEVAKQVRGVYRRGPIYWRTKQVAGKRPYISLETSNLSETVQRVRLLSDGVGSLQLGTLFSRL